MRSIGSVGLLLVAISGCSASHGVGEGPVCGPTRCASDEVCCNASCGICTAPDVGCVALACVLDAGSGVDAGGGVDGALADAGPPTCGGRAGRECPARFFCDYPDRFCGGDDSTGACRPRPSDCPEPGGVTVCGCDGRDHIGECAANFSGVDVAFIGSCADPTFTGSAAAWRECGPDDGPAWRIELSENARSSCDVRPAGTLVIDVWDELDGAAPRTLSIDGSLSTGQAMFCPSADAPCSPLRGTLVIDAFFAGEIAQLDAEFLMGDGTRIAFTDVELTSFWCRLVGPGCG